LRGEAVLFSIELAIPANTAVLTPTRAVLPVSQGVVRHVWVRWHWGSGNLCGVRALYSQFVHWPFAVGEWFYSSPYPVDFAEDYSLDVEPYEIAIEGYNSDDTYAHSVWLAFNILRELPSSDTEAFLASLRGE